MGLRSDGKHANKARSLLKGRFRTRCFNKRANYKSCGELLVAEIHPAQVPTSSRGPPRGADEPDQELPPTLSTNNNLRAPAPGSSPTAISLFFSARPIVARGRVSGFRTAAELDRSRRRTQSRMACLPEHWDVNHRRN